MSQVTCITLTAHTLHTTPLLSCAVAKGRSLFGDPTSEIQDLTQIIKQDLAKLNTDIAHLQQQVRAQSGRETKHMSSHSNTVVVSLQVRPFCCLAICGEMGSRHYFIGKLLAPSRLSDSRCLAITFETRLACSDCC